MASTSRGADHGSHAVGHSEHLKVLSNFLDPDLPFFAALLAPDAEPVSATDNSAARANESDK